MHCEKSDANQEARWRFGFIGLLALEQHEASYFCDMTFWRRRDFAKGQWKCQTSRAYYTRRHRCLCDIIRYDSNPSPHLKPVCMSSNQEAERTQSWTYVLFYSRITSLFKGLSEDSLNLKGSSRSAIWNNVFYNLRFPCSNSISTPS
ncbi:Hypothetical predicted protein [Podarcis lilfordi]|uniref:Uncharacterized protein n=1 Tax=Podarcis lilfordi TaxID=74358 RepID=A0AA35PEI2_9SAUR|nr:Hypothetical predicted protein [Podarcis lilfordi]